MVSVPGFLLRRLYVKGSLRNIGEGFQFELMNQLGSGYAKRLMPLTLDGEETPMESSFFSLDGREVPFSEVSEATPFTLVMNKTTTITVRGATLKAGPHRIGLSFEVQGLGTLSFDFVDEIHGG